MSNNPFDPSAWQAIDGFGLTDIPYHRHVVDGVAQPTVRVAFDRPEVRNAFRPHSVDDVPVVGDVGQPEPVDGLPCRRVKGVVAHAFTASSRNTGQRPARASNSSGLGPVTRPAFLMNPTPVGTLMGNSRSSGRASSADISTMRTRSLWRPWGSRASPAAPTLALQSEPGTPPTTYRLPATVIGVTGVERGLPDLRPGTVSTTGPLPPKPTPSLCSPIIILLTYFSHHGSRMGSLFDMAGTLRDRVDAKHRQAAREGRALVGRAFGQDTCALHKLRAGRHRRWQCAQDRAGFLRRQFHHPDLFGATALDQGDLIGGAAVADPVRGREAG